MPPERRTGACCRLLPSCPWQRWPGPGRWCGSACLPIGRWPRRHAPPAPGPWRYPGWPFLTGRQWFARASFALDVGTESLLLQALLALSSNVSIGIDVRARVPAVEHRFQMLGVMHLGCIGNPLANELMPAVHADITPSRTAIPAYRWWRPHLPRLSRNPSIVSTAG